MDTSTILPTAATLSSKPSASRWLIAPEEIFKENYVSYSRLNTFKNCNKHFELAYLCGLPDPPGSAAYHGSVVHKMLELYSKDQVTSNSKQEFASLHVKEIMQYKGKAIEQEDDLYPINEIDLIAHIRNFIAINKGRDISDILETEQTVLEPVGGYMVKGIIDRIDDGYPKTIIDYKTGKKQYVSKHQLNLYALALLHDTYEPCSLEFQFLKTGETMSWSFTQKEAERTRNWMLDTIATIESKTYFARNTRLCAWCGVRQYCYGIKA
ncbi:MAG: PD-(D/E)XK nuclease family protein [Sphaerochaeta sp.]|nr:PD-(D/E)XK nuclease family protein [Sphaerochaeta sp.]